MDDGEANSNLLSLSQLTAFGFTRWAILSAKTLLAYNVLLSKISKDSSFLHSPKDLHGSLDPRGAAKHGSMPR